MAIGITIALIGITIALMALANNVVQFLLNRITGALEKSPGYRLEVAASLTVHAGLKIYRDRLVRALDWLDQPGRMGPLNTWRGAIQSFNVCLAMSAAYSALFLIVGWMFGGPGSVGNTRFLPSIQEEGARGAQLALGGVLLLLCVAVGLGLIRGKVIDARCEEWLARRLAPFGVTASLAKLPYRIGGAIAAGSLWLFAALYSDLSGAILVGVVVSGATGVTSAAVGTVAGAISIAAAAAGGVGIGGTVTGGVLGVFAITLGGVVVLPGDGATAFAAAFACTFLIAAALIFFGAGPMGVTITLAGAVVVVGLIAVVRCRGDGFLAGSMVGAIGAGAAAAGTVAIAGLTGQPENPFAVALLLFAVILPIVNAVMDWVSWWVSRKLGRRLVATVDLAKGRGRKTGVLAVHMVIDLFVAICLLYLLALALPLVIELFNQWSRSVGRVEPLPLLPFIAQAAQRPIPDAVWALTMLLSTLVPTLVHAVFLTSGPLMLWLRSDDKRHAIAAGLCAENPDYRIIQKASQQLMQAWLVGLIVSAVFFVLFVLAISTLWLSVGESLIAASHAGIAASQEIAVWLGF